MHTHNHSYTIMSCHVMSFHFMSLYVFNTLFLPIIFFIHSFSPQIFFLSLCIRSIDTDDLATNSSKISSNSLTLTISSWHVKHMMTFKESECDTLNDFTILSHWRISILWFFLLIRLLIPPLSTVNTLFLSANTLSHAHHTSLSSFPPPTLYHMHITPLCPLSLSLHSLFLMHITPLCHLSLLLHSHLCVSHLSIVFSHDAHIPTQIQTHKHFLHTLFCPLLVYVRLLSHSVCI